MSLETLELIHKTTHVLTVPLSILLAAWYGPKYGYTRKRAAMYAGAMVAMVLLFTYAWRFVPGWFGYAVDLNSFRSFLFIPLFTYTASEKWNIPTLHGADFVTPILFSQRAMVLVGCTMIGCGRAMPCDWGTYNPIYGYRVFPLDLIDQLSTTVLAVFAFYYAKKLSYKGDGRIFALCMCLSGIVHWLIQFGSMEVWWVRGFNDEAVYSIVTFITAIIIFKRYSNKQKEENS